MSKNNFQFIFMQMYIKKYQNANYMHLKILKRKNLTI